MAGLEQTDAGLSEVVLQIAALIRLAEPTIAFACGEFWSWSSDAIACELAPPSMSGRQVAPDIAYWLPKSTNGMLPPGSYLLHNCCSDALGVCSGCLSRSLVSTARKSM